MPENRSARTGAGRVLSVIPPGAGAAAMSTGIVSVALHLAGIEWFSLCWLVVDAAIWTLLVVVFVSRLFDDRARWVGEADTPPALTGVAATCVLGTRCVLLGWTTVGWALLGIALIAWLALMRSVLRHWTTPTVGVHFLVCVATQGLAVLAATLAVATSTYWLVVPALAAFGLGLIFYVAVLVNFSYNQFRIGAGDQWVFAGALAISALAAGKLAPAVAAAGWPEELHTTLQVAGVVIVSLVLAGYAGLVASEIRWPRLQFDIRRWSTAFPMGMTAAASLTVAVSSDVGRLRPVGLVLVWPAVAICLVLLYASGRRLVRAMIPA
ncbi:tellurite resistance/C4-dicarboxylate transporter family protein [Prescottella sp. R16]|uniref:tellurite resistance/C4-dicarboxylate transporter family protein n=1 Tax=Prescottella sp. R16 TaxID=3064529 RepID=UPI00272E3CDD|nr:tellurite resistance/C4-dicarboxylate transporter family protein [Prescottella sp. R16]